MSEPQSRSSNGQLGAVIAAYLQALERGEQPDRQALLAGHPAMAAELSAYFRDLDRINRLAAPLHLAEAATIGPEEIRPGVRHMVRYFGDYELEAELARGGMGVVFRARQKSLNRPVALKMILTGQLASEADKARFRAEAEAAANLAHPNILPIYEVGEHDGQLYFSMKLIDGGSLASRVAELVPRPRDGAALMARLARAVHFAHQRGILHRDLKPANVLLDPDGTPYVTDFGLAKRTESDSGITRTGAVVGTPSYMPPEQARAEKQLTTATDVYSLGAILYELLTGRPPFRAATAIDTILQVLDNEPAHPRTYNPQADRDLCAIALKCLQKLPEGRYESAAELADDLERWLRGETTRARPPSLAELAWRWLKKNAVAAASVAVLGVVMGLTAVLAIHGDSVGEDVLLYPSDLGWTNPLRWVQLARHDTLFRNLIRAAAVVQALGFGWFLRMAVRPRTPQAALAAGATAGLIATLMLFSILGVVFGMGMAEHGQLLRLHPITYIWENDGRLATGFKYPADEEYLSQYLKPEEREGEGSQRQKALDELRRRALLTNGAYAAVGTAWLVLIFVAVFFLGLTLESAWAVDYVCRSGRPPLARAVCYLELYPATVALILVCLLVTGVAITIAQPNVIGGPPTIWLVTPIALGTAFVSLAHAGVIRRWRPALRAGIYVGLVTVGVALFFVATAS